MDTRRGKRKCDDPVDRRNTSGLEAPKKAKTAAIQDGHFTVEHITSSLPSPELSVKDVSFFDEAFLAVNSEFSEQAALEQLLSLESQNAIVTSTSPNAAVKNFDHLFKVPFDSPQDSIFSLFNDTAGDDTLESIANYIHTDDSSPIDSHPAQVAQNAHDNLFTANPNDIPSFDDWVAEEFQHRKDHSITNLDNVASNPKKSCTSSFVSEPAQDSPMAPSLAHTPVAGFQTLPTLPPNSMQQTPPSLSNGDAFRQTQVTQSVQQLLQQRSVQSQAQYQWRQSKNSRNTSLEFQSSTSSHHSLPAQRPGSNHSTPQTPEAQLSFQKHSQTIQQSPQYVPLSPEQMSVAFDQWLKEEFRKAHKGISAGNIQELYNWGHLALMPEFMRKYGKEPNSPELQHFFIQRKVTHGMWLEDQNRAQYNLALQQQTPTPAQRHQVAIIRQQQLVSVQGSPQQASRLGQQQQILSQASQHQPRPQQSNLGQQHQMALPQFNSEFAQDFTDSINNMTLDQLKQHGTIIQARMHHLAGSCKISQCNKCDSSNRARSGY